MIEHSDLSYPVYLKLREMILEGKFKPGQKLLQEKIAKELLSVRDSLEMGLSAAKGENTELEQIREGMELTLKNLIQVMEKFDIVAVDPMGEKFNPEFHQAMNTQEAEGVESNTVVMVMQKGYTLNDRLIRPALVGVSK